MGEKVFVSVAIPPANTFIASTFLWGDNKDSLTACFASPAQEFAGSPVEGNVSTSGRHGVLSARAQKRLPFDA